MKLILGLALTVVGCTYEITDNYEIEKEDPMITGWAASGKLTTGAGINNRGKGIKLQAELSEDGSITTQFNINGLVANCRAEILSSVKGQTVRRLVTVLDGMSITTRGKNITVTARDVTAAVVDSGTVYTVSILSTVGVRASIQQPPVLMPLEYHPTDPTLGGAATPIINSIIVAPGTSAWVAIPSDAGVNSVFVTAIGGAAGVVNQNEALALQIRGGGGGPMSSWDVIYANGWVPLMPNVAFIELFNNTAAANINYSVIFGIDG